MIAFKLQGFVNDPRRTQDLEDIRALIRALIRANREAVYRDELRDSSGFSTGRPGLMNSSKTRVEARQATVGPSPLAANGGAAPSPPSRRDPFAAMDDLMAVMEALCPSWPPRPGFGPMPRMLL